ncbi:dihydrodipicolinate synthase family protein [Myceligenerans pegani]|uniref:Dihydrodipicolinate synthase family protein n=1 Tax=Myceligenerans pegani TaxID=2776917 RepID=A0ABR9MYW1_9MICO|nr:dihydrodipicolinate synthase family protein [Myceligenerans sp. TRM 65318]MBE1876584.1 dihydrodipicolinate synthase family protein [Myceligenerans sp. TRM 65318]MBE3018855.1 dihydrodipicolinate synthase family protein [Myceligenerans sp. TRM 65318]
MVADLGARLRQGVAIPAHPLALDEGKRLDLAAQRALTRYYADAGVDGFAVGVHTTQFALHADPGMFREVLTLAVGTVPDWDAVRIAGVVGDIPAAVREAELAAELGYDAVLLSPWGMADLTEDTLLARAAAVGEVLPAIGFYLQENVGGLRLSRHYWRALLDLPSTVAVKSAPFDRYRTVDVARTLLEHDRWADVALLTGNDDAIVHDLTTPITGLVGGEWRTLHVRGGLLGQWAVGARAAAGLLDRLRRERDSGRVGTDTLAIAPDLVEVNAAVFDVLGGFRGCVAGVNEVLRQQGLISSAACLDDRERLSPGQAALIAEVRKRFPDLLDEEFVAEHRDRWRA